LFFGRGMNFRASMSEQQLPKDESGYDGGEAEYGG
jgi:hypothetical protein